MVKMKATRVLKKMLNSKKRFIFSVGSSRSSKTYSTYQWILLYCIENENKGKVISIIRKSFPSLRRSVLREFIKFLKDLNLYSLDIHNKTEQTIELYGNTIEFFSLSDDMKIRGSKRDVAYLNEVNEMNYDEANQIFLRTTERIIVDMNPSDSNHWVWSLKGRDNVDYIHSTYKDNPFLEEHIRKQIESYKDLDENYWRIYGLGLPGISLSTIYTNWKEYKDLPPDIIDYSYGLDIGYNHATALIKCYEGEGSNYFEEVIYERHLTVEDLVKRIVDLNITGVIYVDSARPDVIQSLQREGIGAKGANKKVKEGIDYLKSKKMFIHENSVNLIKEIKNYKWKTVNELILDEPVKLNDDAVDAMRYSCFSNRSGSVNMEDIFFKLDENKPLLNW